MKRFHIAMNEELVNKLDEYVATSGETDRTKVIRAALKAYLESKQVPDKTE